MLIVVSYDPLFFCVVCCDFSIFICNFIDLIFLPLFLDESGSSRFYLSFQRTSFWLCWFLLWSLLLFFCLFVCFAFICALIFKISFLLLTLGFFISSFSSFFRCRVGYLFDLFLVSWGMPVLLWTFPLALLLQCPTGFGLLCFHFHCFYAYFDFFFDFFCDLLVIQQRVVQPPYVGILNSFSPVIEI